MFKTQEKIPRQAGKHENMTHNEEKNQSIKTYPEMREIIEVVTKVIKIVIIITYYVI